MQSDMYRLTINNEAYPNVLSNPNRTESSLIVKTSGGFFVGKKLL